jgi:hypothetical protein
MPGKEDSMDRTVACLMFACVAVLGCREEAQEKWLARHQNVPTGEEVDRSLPVVRAPRQNPTLPGGPAQPSPPSMAPMARSPVNAAPSSQGDQELARTIRESLAREPYLRDKMALVDITVRGGEVLLSGVVPDEASRDAARRVVAEVVGEERVLDQLDISGQ